MVHYGATELLGATQGYCSEEGKLSAVREWRAAWNRDQCQGEILL